MSYFLCISLLVDLHYNNEKPRTQTCLSNVSLCGFNVKQVTQMMHVERNEEESNCPTLHIGSEIGGNQYLEYCNSSNQCQQTDGQVVNPWQQMCHIKNK